MKKIFKKNSFIISSIVAIALIISMGCYFAFGGKLEEVYIPEDANLTNTTLSRPTSGSPVDYSAKDNLYIAQGVVTTSSFSTVVTGETKASIVSQEIYAERIVSPDACYKKSISASTFVKVGTECYISNDTYLVRQAKSVDAIDKYQFVNDDSYLAKLSSDDYYNYYGNVPNKLSNYIINDTTILSADYIGVTAEGLYEFSYTLDPTLSTIGIRNEMRTMAGTEKHPVITSVTFKLWLKPNWDIAKTETHAEYKIEMKGLGVVSCEEHTTEYFSFNESLSIPDENYFQSKVDSKDISTELVLAPSTTDILLDTFGDTLEGKPMQLDFKINNDDNLTGQLELSLDIENINNTTATIYLDNLDATIKYENNQIFISTADINGFINLDDYSSLLEDLMFEFGFDVSELENFDANKLLEDLTLTNLEDTLSLNIDTNILGLDILANVNINKNTKEIDATATLFNGLSLSLTSAKEERIKSLDDITFYNFAPLIDTLLNQKIYLSHNSDNISLKMLADFSELKLTGNATIFDKNINFEITPSAIQAEIDGILTKCSHPEEVIGLISATCLAPQIENGIELDFAEILQTANFNSDSNGNLYLSFSIAGIELKVEISASAEGYTLSQILINSDSLDTNFKFEDYLEIEEIDSSLSPIYIDNIFSLFESTELNYKLNINGFDILTNINLATKQIYAYIPDFEIDLWLTTESIYIQKDDFRGTINYDDKDKIIALLAPILGEDFITNINFDFTNLDPIEIIKSLKFSQSEDTFEISFTILGKVAKLTCAVSNNYLDLNSLSLSFEGLALNIESHNLSFKELDIDSFYNLIPLFELIDGGLLSLETTIDTHTIKATIDLKTSKIHAILDNQLKMLIENNNLYANYNDLYFKFDLCNLSPLLEKLKNDFNFEIPEFSSFDVNSIINAVKNLTTSVDGDTTSLGLVISDIPLTIALNSSNNVYSLESVAIQMDNFNLELNPTNSHFISGIDTINQSFIDANDVINNYYDTLISIIKSDYITINASGTIVDKTTDTDYTAIPYTLNFSLPISAKEVKVVATLEFSVIKYENGEKTSESTHTIWINYQNNRIYFDYNGIKGTFNTNEVDRSIASITKIFENIPQLKSLLDSLAELNNINLDISTWDLYSIIKNIKYDENKNLGLVLNLSFLSSSLPDNLELNISKLDTTSLNVETVSDTSFNGIDIGISATISPLASTLEESTFAVTNTADYIVFDSINNLLETLANTVSLRHFHVKANVNISIIGISIDIALDLKVDIDENGVATILAVLDNSSSSALGSAVAFKHDSFKTTLFTRTNSDTIYYSKYYTYKETIWEGSFFKYPVIYDREPTDYGTFTNSDFSGNFMDILIYLLDLSDTVADSLKNPSEETTSEEVFQDYSYDSENFKYSFSLNLSSINSMIGDTTIDIIHTAPENGDLQLSQLNAKIRLMNLLDLTLEATLVDHNNADYGTSAQMDSFITSHSFTPMY